MPPRILPPNDVVIAHYREGLSCGEIAEMYGVKPVTVDSCLRKAGEKLRTPAEAALVRVDRGRCNPSRYWQGKTQPAEMVEKRVAPIRGEKHWLWKGGGSRRNYRDVVEKVECSKCRSKLNLCIHHIDLDHYNNAPQNLQVLCVSCHLSLHKKMYWDAYRAGVETPKSNRPPGWTNSTSKGGATID